MRLLFIILVLLPQLLPAQNTSIDLNTNWQFYHAKNNKWYKATVPGTIHTDLLNNKLIPDPYYRDNESKLQWIGETDWQYKTVFDIPEDEFSAKNIELIFDGLDTYADVYLNGKMILHADNMFREWSIDVKKLVHRKKNELLIQFRSAQKVVDSIAKTILPLVLPDNPRVYARKAQYHFGWDWGPKFVTCGIWKKITLSTWNYTTKRVGTVSTNNIKLVQQKDSTGTSFYFEEGGKPIYCKGANWIPADMFVTRIKKADYRKMLISAKNANMNMLRVWGGGIYEADDFYDLCDSLGIMIWQDFMFAGGMVPGDDHFFNNVKEEVKYQLGRLRHHPCIVLWCGNNEIDEAWNNWGWQQQFNLHGNDSAKIYSDYKRFFNDSLKKWVDEFDGTRPYITTSPMHGWGHNESFIEGDSHYWGTWWGLEDWESFKTKTGRFISEYGMQAMPNMNTINSFTRPEEQNLQSPVIQAHQKANEGFKKLDHYLTRYFIDSVKLSKLSFADYTYLTQCLQYYFLKNSIAVHRSKYPVNMGTLVWQLNDCWPVASWSITDYSRQPKAAWYAVKEAYRDDVLPVIDTIVPKDLHLEKAVVLVTLIGNTITLTTNANAKYIELSKDGNTSLFSENYFDLKKGESKIITLNKNVVKKGFITNLKIKTLYDVINK